MPKHQPIIIDLPPAAEGPDTGERPDAESRAVAEHPAFRALIAESRRRSAAGDRGRPAEDVFRELGLLDDKDGGEDQPTSTAKHGAAVPKERRATPPTPTPTPTPRSHRRAKASRRRRR